MGAMSSCQSYMDPRDINDAQCTTGNPANPATFSNPVPVPAKYWPDIILIFK